ncbi:hypothetical protein EV697_10489 [Bisgaardia hudsonensis]|uniref:Uncharacterized protein n=1 Tax=Bisgaardia hudsonensis TaxID=109472 RepID=A0A4R2MZZ7_9PAST|nr:hypothetical protein [Bisgaardia hudsonensis]QLB12240.1 hypothetical protein A6A11_00710 [Bisgaardia hudsonensis]TCP12283.1 hypothetical protein EV697_10489 [Bisgaardia hudsonensis]
MNIRNIISVYILLFLPIYSSYANETHQTWVDESHTNVSGTLDSWASEIDSWFGETDPNEPGSAVLRIMLDSEWNRYDGYSIKPRIRGKLRLPTLKRRFSLVFGDDSLDNEISKNHLNKNYSKPLKKDTIYDRKQSTEDNKSLAIRWSDSIKNLGIHLKVDLGIRSGSDIYLRFKGDKEWQLSNNVTSRLETIYRLGTKSKHYAQINWENKYTENSRRFFANQLYLGYTNNLKSENIYWGNSLYRQHNYSNYKSLSYGIAVTGKLTSHQFSIDRYGPFINWRQPIWRKWLFIQPEVNFYNNSELDRKHHIGAFFRLEAIF